MWVKQGMFVHRAEREYVGQTAGAAVPHQQMRSLASPYPVDRYLVSILMYPRMYIHK